MSEENVSKTQEEKEIPSCCRLGKYYKKFLVVALGSFVGVYLALSLFAYVQKTAYSPYLGHGFRGAPCHMDCACHKKHRGKTFRPDIKKEIGDMQRQAGSFDQKGPKPNRPPMPKDVPNAPEAPRP